MDRRQREQQAAALLQDLVAAARRAGADAADAVFYEARGLSVSVRLGKPEDVEREESRDLGLRVFVGQGQASVSTSDLGPAALRELTERAVAMARLAPPDAFAGLAPADLLARAQPDLDLGDHESPDVARLTAMARAAEDAARAVPGVTNSEGAGASAGERVFAMAASNGFAGAYGGTSYSVSASVVAGAGTAMESDSDFAQSRHLADLRDAAEVGRKAGEKAVRRLNPRKLPSATVPVVFSAEAARSLLGHFTGAIAGSAIARGTSFLKGRLGAEVFGRGVRIVDDPLRPRGLRSRPFDGEGVKGAPLALIEDGRLTTWLLDCASARQLGLTSTGHASRGVSGPPGPAPSNLYLEPGPLSPEELMADIDQGLFITDLIGFGVNGVTGDYSRGAAGFWIERGQLVFPVSEMTVAGNLVDMFQRLVPASDLVFRYGTDAPTVRIDGLAVAGR